MGSASASKPKKNSGEDRRKRKKIKRRKGRRVSPSPSSYSSDPDDFPRRRRSSRRKSMKRRGRDLKRSSKKKHRKLRSLSSSSSDSGSVSDRSRSPVLHRDDRKGKLKKVKRGRKLDVDVRSSRSRYRSLSCSASSSRDSMSNTPGRIHRYKENKTKEMDGSRQIESSSVNESRGDVEVTYEGGGREMESELNMANYDDILQPNTDPVIEKVEQERMLDSGSHERETKIDRWMCDRDLVIDSYFDRFEDRGTQSSELYNQLDANFDYSRRVKSEIVAFHKHDSECDDLELMLRKKALENLSKLRAGLSSDRAKTDKETALANESSENPNISLAKSDSSISKQKKIQAEIPADESKVDPVIKLSPMEPNYSTSEKKLMFGHLNDSRNSRQLENNINSQSTSNSLSVVENFTEKLSYVQSSGDVDSRSAVVCLGDRLASGNTGPNGKEKVCETNGTIKECQSGSQFEKKTFSRMHDGEVVQVSYKVYIPNKTPALARRKLQR